MSGLETNLKNISVSSEVEMNRTWTDNIILFQTLQLHTRLDINTKSDSPN